MVCIPRLTLPKEFLNDNNDSKLTMLGGRLFQTLIIRSLKMFSHINSTMVDAQFIWASASCSTAATRRLQVCCNARFGNQATLTVRLREYTNVGGLVTAINGLSYNTLRNGSGHNIFAAINVARTQAFTIDQVSTLLIAPRNSVKMWTNACLILTVGEQKLHPCHQWVAGGGATGSTSDLRSPGDGFNSRSEGGLANWSRPGSLSVASGTIWYWPKGDDALQLGR